MRAFEDVRWAALEEWLRRVSESVDDHAQDLDDERRASAPAP